MLEFAKTTPANGKIKEETYATEQGVQTPPEHTHENRKNRKNKKNQGLEFE